MSFSAANVRILNACFAGIAPRFIQCEMADRLTSHWRATALLPPTFFMKLFKSDIYAPQLLPKKKFTKCNKKWQSCFNQFRKICSYLKEGHFIFLIDALDLSYASEPLPSACLDSRQLQEGLAICWFTGPPRVFFLWDNMVYSWRYVFWAARRSIHMRRFDVRSFFKTLQANVEHWKERGRNALLSRRLALLGDSRLKQRVKVIKDNENAFSLEFSPPETSEVCYEYRNFAAP